MKEKKTLFCFTPAVSLGTFFLEFALACFVLSQERYRKTFFGLASAFFIFLLGAFQFAEYAVCRFGGGIDWARFAFLVITPLPVLGVHLVDVARGKKASPVAKFGYVCMAAFLLFFGFSSRFFFPPVCAEDFVLFAHASAAGFFYTLYYFGFIAAGLLSLIIGIRRREGKKDVLEWMTVAYLSCILPWLAVRLFSDIAFVATPSILCGFAVLLAVIHVWKTLPAYHAS